MSTATETADTVTSTRAKKDKAPLAPSLGEYLAQVLSDAKSQMGVYESKLPPATLQRVRNGKAGLRITALRDQISADDEHGQAYLVSAKTVEAIETALALASNLTANRIKAKERARAKAAA